MMRYLNTIKRILILILIINFINPVPVIVNAQPPMYFPSDYVTSYSNGTFMQGIYLWQMDSDNASDYGYFQQLLNYYDMPDGEYVAARFLVYVGDYKNDDKSYVTLETKWRANYLWNDFDLFQVYYHLADDDVIYHNSSAVKVKGAIVYSGPIYDWDFWNYRYSSLNTNITLKQLDANQNGIVSIIALAIHDPWPESPDGKIHYGISCYNKNVMPLIYDIKLRISLLPGPTGTPTITPTPTPSPTPMPSPTVTETAGPTPTEGPIIPEGPRIYEGGVKSGYPGEEVYKQTIEGLLRTWMYPVFIIMVMFAILTGLGRLGES